MSLSPTVPTPASRDRVIRNNPDFSVIDETEHYIVVDKPAPLLTHPSKPGNPATLWDGLRALLAYEIANGGQISIINRLDRETSGLVLAAKNRDTARQLSLLMQERRIHKEYLALVLGWPDSTRFTVDAPILRRGDVAESRIWLKQTVHPQGAPAVTECAVLDRFPARPPELPECSLIRCRPITGRMHQIRVHLAHAGHPIVGDKIYGPDENCYLDFIETGWTESLARRLTLPRQALHSSVLEIPARGGGETLRWTSPAPPEFSL